MKKITFLLAVLLTVWNARAFADFIPENAKNGKVKWYFFESLSLDERAGSIFTAVENEVLAYPKADYSDPDQLARQLWCFETEDGTNWVITNRYDGRKLGVGLGRHGEALYMRDYTQTTFQISQDTDVDGLILWANMGAPGGGDQYRTPCPTGEDWDYVVWLIQNHRPADHAPSFKCVEYKDAYDVDVPEGEFAWFNIVSADKDGEGELIADNTSVVDAQYSFTVEKKESGDKAAQWRLVESVPGKVALINRATGNSISSALSAVDRYNVPTAGKLDDNATAWQLRPISEEQYTISSLGSADKIRRMLTAQTLGDEPNEYIEDSYVDTYAAWKFVKADTEVGIDNATVSNTVTVEDGRIVAPAGATVTVTTPDGIKLSAASRLAPGVYLVTVNGKTTKILVNR